MASIGGTATTSTGRVMAHLSRSGASKSRGTGGLGPVGGSASTSTGRVASYVGKPARGLRTTGR